MTDLSLKRQTSNNINKSDNYGLNN